MAELRPASEMKDSGIEWIGTIPIEWSVPKILYVLKGKITDGPHETPDYVDNGIPFISIDSLNESKRIDFSTCKRFISEAEYHRFAMKTVLEEGDILFSKAATIGKTAIVGNERFMIWSPIAILKNNPSKVSNQYLYYLLNCSELITAIALSGSMNTQINVGMRELEQARIPLPATFEEQQAISHYLDDRCSKIDEIIAEATASIEEYKELKQAVIFEAVTKGISNLPSKHREELDWAGNVCLQWPIQQIRYLYRLRNEKNDLPLDQVNLISLYTDRGVLQHSDIDEETITGNKAVTADGYKIVYPNDIVVNIILCWMGAMGMSNYYGVTSPAYDIYEPIDTDMVDSRYYHYLFRTDRFAKKCYTLGRGIMMMRWRTYSSEFRSIKVPVPSIGEQRAIVDYLDERTKQMDALISEKLSLIDDLQAYKKSLIYEVVTGKRRVV